MDEFGLPAKIQETLLVKLLPEPMKDRFVEILLSVSKRDEIQSGDVLFEIGATNTDRGCLFMEGALKVTRGDGEVRYLESPDILGEVQLFKPQAARTATVEVVIGGPVLFFAWHDLGAAAQKEFDAEELASLREIIMHSASMRERDILEKNDGS